MFRYSKCINEYEFPPLEVLHQLLISLRLGRHFKGEFRLTKRGAELAGAPARMFAELIPFFVLQIDHSSYAHFEDRPFGKWDVWMNVINVEADHGSTERSLFAAFYGEDHDWYNAGWREMAAFSSCVLRPLEGAGLLAESREECEGRHVYHVFKTPLWRSALKLDTDDMLQPVPAAVGLMFTRVFDPETPPVPRFTVLVTRVVVAPVPMPSHALGGRSHHQSSFEP